MKATLKSDDVEEWLDLKIVRPLGYWWTLFFYKLGVHPNTVTVLSMIIGGASGFFLSRRADTTEGRPVVPRNYFRVATTRCQ